MDNRRKIVHGRSFRRAAVISALFACLCFMRVGSDEVTGGQPANFVRVYYFHGNFRCVNCHNMEKWTKETVETRFSDELDSGRLDFQVINIETKGNEHFAGDYQLYTKSVVLSLVKDGKEVKSENLAKIWDYLRDKKKFCRYIRVNIKKYLKEL